MLNLVSRPRSPEKFVFYQSRRWIGGGCVPALSLGCSLGLKSEQHSGRVQRVLSLWTGWEVSLGSLEPRPDNESVPGRLSFQSCAWPPASSDPDALLPPHNVSLGRPDDSRLLLQSASDKSDLLLLLKAHPTILLSLTYLLSRNFCMHVGRLVTFLSQLPSVSHTWWGQRLQDKLWALPPPPVLPSPLFPTWYPGSPCSTLRTPSPCPRTLTAAIL